jgi:O-antigen/teichoic acid export membrane protein
MDEDNSKTETLSSITRGASLYFIGKVTVDVLGFLLQLVLTRGLGAGLYGVYAYGKTILGVTLVFTNFGSDNSLLKYLPQYKDKPVKQQFVFALAIGTSLTGGIVSAIILYVFAPTISNQTLDSPQFIDVLRLFALLVVFDTIAKILYSTFRSLERLEYEILSNKLIRPALRLIAAVLALGLGYSVIGVMVALIVANLLALGVALFVLLTRFELRPSISSTQTNRSDIYDYYNFSVPLTLKDAGDILMKRVDILMVGFFLSATSVGIYNISVLLSGVLTLPLAAFNQLFPPIASRLYSNGDIERIDSLYNTVTRWIFTITLVMAIGAIVYRRELLSLFGEEFTKGTVVLVLFVTAQLFNSLGGANGYLLMMANRQYILVLNQWSFGILNGILNYVFIIKFGLVGAALATASVLVALNLVKTIELWYLEGLFPYSRKFAKPIAAGVIAAVVMIFADIALDGILLIFIGGGVGVGVYIISLLLLGIEQDDKAFFRDIISEHI